MIAYFGIGHMYCPIIPVTKNIPVNETSLVRVEKIPGIQTSCSASKIASLTGFHVCFASFTCLAMLSTTKIASSTSIPKTKIKANKVILFTLSPIARATQNVIAKTKGIENDALIASLNHKKRKIVTKRIAMDSNKFVIKLSVASFAFFHSSWIVTSSIPTGKCFCMLASFSLISFTVSTAFVHLFFAMPM